MTIRRAVPVVVLSALALVLAACGGDDSEGGYREPAGPAVDTVELQTGNTYFEPDTVTASPPGVVEISLENVESGIHDIVIRDLPGFQVEVSGDGDTASQKVELERGEYEFYCTVPGHEEAGMKGTLTVS